MWGMEAAWKAVPVPRGAGALANLGPCVADQSVGGIATRYGIPAVSKRNAKTIWKDFLSAHLAALTGIDFSTSSYTLILRLRSSSTVTARMITAPMMACCR